MQKHVRNRYGFSNHSGSFVYAKAILTEKVGIIAVHGE
mgnify:CR=1 FL=1